MKNQTYQLSAQGIERLEKFKRDVLAGDFEFNNTFLDDEQFDWTLISTNGIATVYCFESAKPVETALVKIDNTLTGGIQKRIMSHDNSIFYCSKENGIGLMRTDITTPAQRVLEALGKKLNQGSYANA